MNAADRHLSHRCPWLKEHKLPPNLNPLNFTKADISKAQSVLAKHGFTMRPYKSFFKHPHTIEYDIQAPRQPRPLQVLRAYNRDKLRTLQARIVIRADRCELEWAGAMISSSRLIPFSNFTISQSQLKPTADIDYLIDILEAIKADRVCLLRAVQDQELGHAGPSVRMAYDRFIDLEHELEDQIATHAPEHAKEAILYSWSGFQDIDLMHADGLAQT
jgi:hypothetical protein